MVKRFSADFFNLVSTRTISEYRNADFHINVDDRAGDRSYEVYDFISKNVNLGEVIFRDRVLRNIPFDHAFLLVRRAVYRILQVLERENFQVLITYPVDNYVTDLLCQVAFAKGLQVYGISNFFIDGYKRVTTYGEHCFVREPSDTEVQDRLLELQGDFQSTMAPFKGKAVRRAIQRYLKYKARYATYYLFLHKLLKRQAYDFSGALYDATTRNLDNFQSYFELGKKVNINRNDVLVPLHFFPEATLEYWSDNPLCIDYPASLLTVLERLSRSGYRVLVKEHPSMVFNNSSKFYRQIKSVQNVTLVDPFELTHKLLEEVDSVVCWTGSMGLEALVRGKQVHFVCNNYYLQASSEISLDTQGEGFISIKDPERLLREVLSGTVIWH